jgi:hypothetical protein
MREVRPAVVLEFLGVLAVKHINPAWALGRFVEGKIYQLSVFPESSRVLGSWLRR